MTSETYGMFGPRGLLAKIEAEGNNGILGTPSLKKVPENTDGISTPDKGPIRQQQQEPPETLDQDVEDFCLYEKTNGPIPIVPLSDLSPIEAAFSIEKIRNLIFSYLNPCELLPCRLVSTSWLLMATNDKMQKSKQIFLVERKRNLQDLPCPFVEIGGQTRFLKDLTQLLDGVGSHPIPFSYLRICGMTISQNEFVNFLDRYGFLFKSLAVTFQAEENGHDFVYQLNSLLEFVTKLLTEQMPNLQFLRMIFGFNAKIKGEIDPQKFTSIRSMKSNENLRKIKFDKRMPYQIVEAACSLAPKLEALKMYDLGFWAKNKHRLSLLKKINFMPSLDDWDQVDALEFIVDSEEILQLKKLATDFFLVHDKPEVLPRLASLLTKILEKSCNSLEELFLDKVYFLPGTVLPRMPKVKELTFFPSDWANPEPEWSWLPQGTSVADTFPILHAIRFHESSSVTQFLSLCKNEEVASVKWIVADDLDMDQVLLENRFPNARAVPLHG